MTKYDFNKMLEEEHSLEDLIKILEDLIEDTNKEFERVSENACSYSIGFTTGQNSAYKNILLLIETLSI